MVPYLFLWNPKKDSKSFTNYERVQQEARAGRSYTSRWICPSKQPRPGDIAFVQRTGSVNNGIFAKGIVTAEPFENDEGTRVVALRLDLFLPIGQEIPREEIVAFAEYKARWSPMASGNVINESIYSAIQTIWASRSTSFASTLMQHEAAFLVEVERSMNETSSVRAKRLEDAPTVPRRINVTTQVFVRNADVVAEALLRAAGVCQVCRKAAPFFRKTDGTPYLEVHHKVQLAHGGEDTVANAIATCPNCHRSLHFAAAA